MGRASLARFFPGFIVIEFNRLFVFCGVCVLCKGGLLVFITLIPSASHSVRKIPPDGLEPSTYALGVRCSVLLSYEGKMLLEL